MAGEGETGAFGNWQVLLCCCQVDADGLLLITIHILRVRLLPPHAFTEYSPCFNLTPADMAYRPHSAHTSTGPADHSGRPPPPWLHLAAF